MRSGCANIILRKGSRRNLLRGWPAPRLTLYVPGYVNMACRNQRVHGLWVKRPGIKAFVIELRQRAMLRKQQPDRKSTRLNSSHVRISYAVFCLKKKKMIAAIHQLVKRQS